ncbi:type-F conjugative transfer system mating-pair stabilization protein TraN [Serratia liquefaciens]|uniref:type-F conjugative transfer system mating-pair stabilization protein TraN n=1 Tax=Serratia liquefaciens TaxID=614 RepID=UPI00390689F6
MKWKPVFNNVALLVLHAGILAGIGVSFQCVANDDYKQGSDYAHQVQGQGTNSLTGFKPADVLPNYTSNPKETGYYGGVKGGDTGAMVNEGNQALGTSDTGKTITDSVLNNPKEPISKDAPFISGGKKVEQDAEEITKGTGEECGKGYMHQTVITSHFCERDLATQQYCDRPVTIGGHYETEYEDKSAHMGRSSIRWWREGNRVRGEFVAPFTGTLNSASFNYEVLNELHTFSYPIKIDLFGTSISYGRNDWGRRDVSAPGFAITEGQPVTLFITIDPGGQLDSFLDALVRTLNGNSQWGVLFDLDFSARTSKQVWKPSTSVEDSCPLAQDPDAVKINTVCSEPGGERTVVVDGIAHAVYSDCWKFTDTYRVNEETLGSCAVYANDTACTVAARTCAYGDESGACVHENVTYSCEKQVSAEGMMCGGDFFCTDGACELTRTGKNNMFQKAISQLAAVAAAGDDVAALNGIDVRAFTGKPQSCRKAAAGFSNCCKDSGWGNSVGLAHCDSEEKALGKAKEKKLVVDVGEYCSRKVLGVCLQRKRSYCLFDSKLAQIVQQQGRQWQLGIGFGGAKNPDCRGITIDELQRINFENLDFANFYDDLMNGTSVPDDGKLLERVKQQIQDRLNNASDKK